MNGKPAAAPMKEPKVEPKPETKCFYCKGTVTGSGITPNAWQIRRLATSTKYIRVINVYLTSTPGSTGVLDTSSVAIIGDLKQKLRTKRRLAKGEVTMCVGSVSKVDEITIARSICLRDQY